MRAGAVSPRGRQKALDHVKESNDHARLGPGLHGSQCRRNCSHRGCDRPRTRHTVGGGGGGDRAASTERDSHHTTAVRVTVACPAAHLRAKLLPLLQLQLLLPSLQVLLLLKPT